MMDMSIVDRELWSAPIVPELGARIGKARTEWLEGENLDRGS
jgi:hypothetical protein